jgi:hypothetical protein
MIEAIETTPAPCAAEEPDAVPENPAIARCMKAYARAKNAAIAMGKGSVFCALRAEEAYRYAMPRLSGDENIRDFIACVAHGMLIDAISSANTTRLLYAAQIAHTTVSKKGLTRKSAAK